jgi:hypothetical protein
MAANQVGDVTGILGIVISLGGFVVTLVQLNKSKKAAEAAKQAANVARASIFHVGAVADLASGIAIMDEIKRFQRHGPHHPLPDRYAALRKILSAVRAGRPDLPALREDQKSLIQTALVNLAKAEEIVEKALSKSQPVDFPRLNRALSKDVDQLQELLVQLQSSAGDGRAGQIR